MSKGFGRKKINSLPGCWQGGGRAGSCLPAGLGQPVLVEFSPTPKFVYLIGWFIDLASQLKIEERGEALGQRR